MFMALIFQVDDESHVSPKIRSDNCGAIIESLSVTSFAATYWICFSAGSGVTSCERPGKTDCNNAFVLSVED